MKVALLALLLIGLALPACSGGGGTKPSAPRDVWAAVDVPKAKADPGPPPFDPGATEDPGEALDGADAAGDPGTPDVQDGADTPGDAPVGDAPTDAPTEVVPGDPGVDTGPAVTLCETHEDCAVPEETGACAPQRLCVEGRCVRMDRRPASGTHPCSTAPLPCSASEKVNACVCDIDGSCCDLAWGPRCAELARTICRAHVSCTADADCAPCSDGDACAGAWSCKAGTCRSIPVICPVNKDTFCRKNTCDPATGTCFLRLRHEMCDDGDPCTFDRCSPTGSNCKHASVPGCGCYEGSTCAADGDCKACSKDDPCGPAWVCAGGACKRGGAMPASCDDGDPSTWDHCDTATGACLHSAAANFGIGAPCGEHPTPGSGSPKANTCVCADLPSCCLDAWGPECVALARTACGFCDCTAKPPVCTDDQDCATCNDGNRCNGHWGCDTTLGLCAFQEPKRCDPFPDLGCARRSCNPKTGSCLLFGDDTGCDDGDPCTDDACQLSGVTGACAFTPIAGCGATDPCTASTSPASTNAVANACVCGLDAFCCSSSWDTLCVLLAEIKCGLGCACDPETCGRGCEP